MVFRILQDDPSGALSYLLGDPAQGEAVLIDPRGADVPLWRAILAEQSLRLVGWARTHQHDDLHPGEFAALQGLPGPWWPPQARQEALPVGRQWLRRLATPGHTPHCHSYLWQDRLFCGGLLAVDACPDQPLPADPAVLWDSVQRVFGLPAETLLFVGHAGGPQQPRPAVSLLQQERRDNPWFGRGDRDDFLARMAALAARRRH